MSEVPTPPTPPHPHKAAHGLIGRLKGQPKWVYIMGVGVLFGVAYLTWRRHQAAAADAAAADAAPSPDAASGDTALADQPVVDSPVYGYSGGGVTAGPTQGAYGGYDTPPDNPATDGSIIIQMPAPTNLATPDNQAVPKKHHTTGKHVTGGGLPHRHANNHKNPVAHHKSTPTRAPRKTTAHPKPKPTAPKKSPVHKVVSHLAPKKKSHKK